MTLQTLNQYGADFQIKVLSSLLTHKDFLINIHDIVNYRTKNLHPGSNEFNIIKFYYWLKLGGKLPYNVFKVGNSKLPFLNFSTLPGSTCPGAGECLNYCYSFKSWRRRSKPMG